MKRVGTIAVCLASGLTLAASLHADDIALAGNPYAVVVARNIFGLNPPPVVDPNAAAIEPPVKIIPNGIMTIFGQLQVLFKVAAKKPGDKDANYILTEGQRQDDIEVTKINESKGVITFNNHGIVQELPLVATAPSSTPAPATAGGNSGTPRFAPGRAPDTAVGGTPGNSSFISRFGNRGGMGGNNPGGGGNDGDGLRNVPTRGGNTMEQNSLSPEESMITTVAAKANAFQQGNSSAPIFPPTPLDSDAGVPSNLAQEPPTPGGSTSK